MTKTHINSCVDYQLNIWQFSKPSTMFLTQQECMQYLLDCSIFLFSLFIDFWMVSSGIKCFCAKEFPKRFPKLHYQLWVCVTSNCLGNCKTSHNICKE